MKHKFGAKRCEREGIKFPSRLERACFDHLTFLQNQGVFHHFHRQACFDLPGGVRHYVDFMVIADDGVIYIESKGRDLAQGRLKRKQCEDLYGVTINVAKSAGDVDKIVRLSE